MSSILAGLGITSASGAVVGTGVAALSFLAGQTSPGLAQFKAQYETSPIYLVNGLAGTNQTMAFTALLPQSAGFAYFRPLSGASLLKNRCTTYPMFNQVVAGNAMIADGIPLSIEMKCPSTPEGVPYLQKAAAMNSLVASLKQHNSQGGVYSVNTPGFLFQNGVMLDFRDITPEDSGQVQEVFSLDFFFPLITIADAQAAMSSFLQLMSNGAAIGNSPSWSTGAGGSGDILPTDELAPESALS